MHPSTFLTIASLAAGAMAARSMGYCMDSDRFGGDIGLTKFCCDPQFDFRLNEVRSMSQPHLLSISISRDAPSPWRGPESFLLLTAGLTQSGVCNIPSDSCYSIAECCKTDFYVFNTCPDTFPCENSLVDKVCRRGSGYVDPGQPK